MIREIPLIQLGVGGVGRAVIGQILSQRNQLIERYQITLHYRALIDSSGALYPGEPLGVDVLHNALQAKQAGQPLAAQVGGQSISDWLQLLPAQPCIIVDATAAAGLETGLVQAIQAGHRVVLANKRPLTSDLATFHTLANQGLARYEATVGAGLPVISTLRNLLDTGDRVQRIAACLSGTLGYLCTALEQDQPLSAALRVAKANGWTEPDPRDDLSGADVARKALTLARTCGLPWTMDHVPSTALFPLELASVSVQEFLQRAEELDGPVTTQVAAAREQQATLRYVATITPEGAQVGLQAVPLDQPLASLQGTDNMLAFTTERYPEQPLVIRGAGAGTAVTAAGLLGDIIATAREF